MAFDIAIRPRLFHDKLPEPESQAEQPDCSTSPSSQRSPGADISLTQTLYLQGKSSFQHFLHVHKAGPCLWFQLIMFIYSCMALAFSLSLARSWTPMCTGTSTYGEPTKYGACSNDSRPSTTGTARRHWTEHVTPCCAVVLHLIWAWNLRSKVRAAHPAARTGLESQSGSAPHTTPGLSWKVGLCAHGSASARI